MRLVQGRSMAIPGSMVGIKVATNDRAVIRGEVLEEKAYSPLAPRGV